MAFECLEVGDGLYQNGDGELDILLAPDSGLELLPGGEGVGGLNIIDEQRAPVAQSFTPTLYSNTTAWTQGSGTAAGRYVRMGGFVFYAFKITFGSGSSVGTSNLRVSLPVTADTSFLDSTIPSGRAQSINSGVANSQGPAYIVASDRVGLYYDYYGNTVNAAPTTPVLGNAPFTPGSADYYSGFITYLAA